MDCIHRRHRSELLCSEPDVLASNDGHAKVIRREEHCTPGLCGDFTSYPCSNMFTFPAEESCSKRKKLQK